MSFELNKRGLLDELGEIGLKYNSDHYLLLDFLLQSYDDVGVFMTKCWTGNVPQSVEKLRRLKRQQIKMSLEEFKEMFNTKKKQALELLFQEPVSSSLFTMVEDIDLDQLYLLSMKNITHSLISILKNIEIVNKEDGKYENELDFLFS